MLCHDNFSVAKAWHARLQATFVAPVAENTLGSAQDHQVCRAFPHLSVAERGSKGSCEKKKHPAMPAWGCAERFLEMVPSLCLLCPWISAKKIRYL